VGDVGRGTGLAGHGGQGSARPPGHREATIRERRLRDSRSGPSVCHDP
jgi:hypothetical protein